MTTRGLRACARLATRNTLGSADQGPADTLMSLSSENLEGGALTYTEIKAMASSNPAVMEKVKVFDEPCRDVHSSHPPFREL